MAGPRLGPGLASGCAGVRVIIETPKIIGVILGLYRGYIRGCIGIVEKKMETTM